MTLSVHYRCANLKMALISFLDALGDRPLRSLDISPLNYPCVLPTTWTELTNQGLLQDSNIQDAMYGLTNTGYVEALRVSGRSDEPQFQEKIGKLCKVLKDSLKDRTDFALIPLPEIVAKSGLSEGFVENAVDADLIRHMLGRAGAHWDGQSTVVRVPHDFGLIQMTSSKFHI